MKGRRHFAAQKRTWTHGELLDALPAFANILDIGAGPKPLRVRDTDRLTTVDFAPHHQPDVVADVSRTWPFDADMFDLIYMAHVVEHFYPRDRDEVIRHVHRSLKPGGLLVVRVPHWSSIQGIGWEHHSQYALNSFMSLTHGENPQLPRFELVTNGVATSVDFYSDRNLQRRLSEWLLNRSWNMTERRLCRLFQVAEVQMVLRKPPD